MKRLVGFFYSSQFALALTLLIAAANASAEGNCNQQNGTSNNSSSISNPQNNSNSSSNSSSDDSDVSDVLDDEDRDASDIADDIVDTVDETISTIDDSLVEDEEEFDDSVSESDDLLTELDDLLEDLQDEEGVTRPMLASLRQSDIKKAKLLVAVALRKDPQSMQAAGRRAGFSATITNPNEAKIAKVRKLALTNAGKRVKAMRRNALKVQALLSK